MLGVIFEINKKKQELKKLENQLQKIDKWNDEIQKKVELLKKLKKEIEEIESLKKDIENILELSNELEKEYDKEVEKILSNEYQNLKTKLEKYTLKKLFKGKYDEKNAILSIHSGTGGVDAQDWAEMLMRMYMRFCEKIGFKTKILDINYGKEKGIKSVIIFVKGEYAYGYLKRETGVHRLVRISPFDAEAMRHTSFALVEVLPELHKTDIKINENDLKIEFFRASGRGGQNINKVETAVRITHIPSKITVTCQSERTQAENRKIAMKILRSKLYNIYKNYEKRKKQELKGDYKVASFGNQIRSYILHPYKLVKDLRTKVQTSDVDKVLDGDIFDFIKAEVRIQL